MLFSGFQKYLAALFFIMICASASLAAADDLGLFSTLTMHPNDSPKNTSAEINSDGFAGYSTKLASVSAALENKDMPVSSVNECFEETAAITLHKDGDKTTWSLIPSLSRYSFDPLDDLKNIQVLLRYKF